MYNGLIARKGVLACVLISEGGWSIGMRCFEDCRSTGKVRVFEDMRENQGVALMNIGSSPPVVIMDIIANIKEK